MLRTLMFVVVTLILAFGNGCTLQPVVTTSGETTPVAESDVSGELIVFAAASLTDAFNEIAAQFQADYPNTTVIYNFAGSQQLAQQLGQGAPADLFASANSAQMNVAIESGRIISGTQRNFVRNQLVVVYPADNPAGITTLQDLATPGIKLILAAPEVPVGAYSLDFLAKAGATVEFGSTYSETVLSNVVSYEENVRSVLSKMILGEADAGIVYTSDVFGDAATQVGQIAIPDALNTVARYPLATIADSENPALAQAFMEYILSDAGQTILADYGFIPVNAP